MYPFNCPILLSAFFWEAKIQVKKITLFHDKTMLQILTDIVNKNEIETMIEDWEIPGGPNMTLLAIFGITHPC